MEGGELPGSFNNSISRSIFGGLSEQLEPDVRWARYQFGQISIKLDIHWARLPLGQISFGPDYL